MNHVDRAYGLIANSDDFPMSAEARRLKENALESIEKLYDYLDNNK